MRPVSLPRSSNRTCRFPASGFPTEFSQSPRRSPPRHANHTMFPEDELGRKPARSASRVTMPLTQEVPHPPLHVTVHDVIGPGQRPVAEVLPPSPQLRVETGTDL